LPSFFPKPKHFPENRSCDVVTREVEGKEDGSREVLKEEGKKEIPKKKNNILINL